MNRNILLNILVTTFVMILGMTLFELCKHYVVPNITIWQSHVITIIFATVVGTITGYFAISKIRNLYFIALTEIERRKHFQGEIAKISEREKRLLGESLHDGLGQQLTGISYMLQTLGHKCSSENESVKEKFDKISDLITNATDLTRNIAKGIYPVGLKEYGLSFGLEELATNTQNVFNISCEVKYDQNMPDKIIDLDSSRQLYLLTQEAINNSIKHGRADVIVIELSYLSDKILLKITDNGIGFDEKSNSKRGIGFAIMEHRAELLGGKLSIHGKPGEGTVVSCELKK